MSTLAVIAGAGGLPAAVVEALPTRPLICALQGNQPTGLDVDLFFGFERLVPFLRALAERGVDAVVFAGAVNRPALNPEGFDGETAQLIPGFLQAIQGGDDGALRWIIALFEDFGFTVAGVDQIAPHLLAPAVPLGARAATPSEQEDARRARAILSALDPVDVAQGCVVAQGLCLGIETLYGTERMLFQVAENRTLRHPQRGGVFVKRAKVGQDLRVDLPTIGPETVAQASRAGLTAICVQAGSTIVLDRETVIAAADAAGIALWGET